MYQTTRHRGLLVCGTTWLGVAAVAAASIAAIAQEVLRAPHDPNQVQVYLVRQDAADCSGSNVPNVDLPLVGGNAWVTRMSDGNTNVKIAMTVKPNTTYHFYLKCVRQLGDISTDGEGVANISFIYPTNSVGNVYAFDMYPEGAPSGNKYQSAQVAYR